MPQRPGGSQSHSNLQDHTQEIFLEELDYLDRRILPSEIDLIMKHCSDLLQILVQGTSNDPKI